MRRPIACVLTPVAALCLTPSLAAASGSPWKPVGLADQVVTANLKRASPGFKAFLGAASCSGQATVAHCTVKASVSNDDVVAQVSFTRHRDGTHLKYVDKLTLTAVMGGATTTRTFYGNIYT
ncbi:MAG: hypothetical protein DLM64_08150 [Solirubrobacterales bacterium]|nr:MAG: hypothetical protein DLM64_08150 [Solirubrobacterales bacterium]